MGALEYGDPPTTGFESILRTFRGVQLRGFPILFIIHGFHMLRLLRIVFRSFFTCLSLVRVADRRQQ